MSSKEIIREIVNMLEEARIKYNVTKEKLDADGKVVYANGNDGTSFDWHVNWNLCEFGYGMKNSYLWAFKLCIGKNGKARVFCYPNGEMRSVECIEKQITDEKSMKKLYRYMMDHADNKGLYDATLEDLGIKY